MEQPLEQYEHAGLIIKIYPDTTGCMSPREDDNLGKLVIYSRGRYLEVNELDMTFRPDDYAGWDELEKNVLECYPGAELLPIYRYEHGGVAYNTTGFSCPWDSGRVGFIMATRETLLSEYNLKHRVSAKVRKLAREVMASEVSTYSHWANGDCYGYVIEDETGEHIDSCWGYIEDNTDYVKHEAEQAAEYIAKDLPTPEHRKQQREAVAAVAEAERAGQQRLFG